MVRLASAFRPISHQTMVLNLRQQLCSSPCTPYLPARPPLFSFSITDRSFQLTYVLLFLNQLHCGDSTFTIADLNHAPYHHRRATMATNSSIPLHCNICPKRPNFSDVSHLLTHIASKGHLSNYYKIKVRSSSELDSRSVIEAYDRWYAEWNVETLMSDRMNQKDKRRTRPRAAGIVFASYGGRRLLLTLLLP
jgi:hypothetical protein